MRYLFAVMLLCFNLSARGEESAAPEIAPPDETIVALLEELEYDYEIDEDGDFRLLFEFDDERSQLVWIRNRTYESGGVAMRDVWSTAFKLPGKYLSVKLSHRLLGESWDGVMGGWALDREHVVYMVKLPAEASAELLDAAIGEAIDQADKLESERSQVDDW